MDRARPRVFEEAMDVDSNYSSDVTIRESEEYVQTLASRVTQRKGRGFREQHARDEIQYEPIDGQKIQAVEGWILIVTNVHQEATDEDIQEIFAEFGPLKSRHLNIDRRTGYVKGYALIEYESYKEAENAQKKDNQLQLYGQTLGVNWAFSSGPLY